ncbi:helix-turn-helix domain-containing protein [Parvibaculum sp.]|uniref:helix-turn-helix domain-containing protein n=1 Tax=Parvibaculum sp. TaxID=2024848 RepID=UPI00272F3762|nr:helix-turn-helix transcriptional regulator [Parvibaculum sp.]MDP1628484.1 helix-turn-helix transcriptional regulator [Parvibaculum sp.]MDP2151816.1 helix-turn-helix transcriptional regulator [Parvibaculum sp.]MDP3326939.1 helix-turn-helix transcriptional regulator [Parvibaculum sp.]
MSNKPENGLEFGDRLLAAREARGLNQTELAKASGLQPAAIGHFEKNRRKPSFANVRALAKALEVSADYLLGRSPTMKGATTAFRGEENLSAGDREHIQMMIDLINKKKGGDG